MKCGRPPIRSTISIAPLTLKAGSTKLPKGVSRTIDHYNGTMYVTEMIGGALWLIGIGAWPELWIQDPALLGVVSPVSGLPFPIGANGVLHKTVYVSVTFLPRLVAIPIEKDGSAGAPPILVSPDIIFGMGCAALDDIALDVFGNIYAAMVGTIARPWTVLRVSPGGTQIHNLGPLPASVTTLAFGTGRTYRKTLFVGITTQWGGTASGIFALDVGVPGLPLP